MVQVERVAEQLFRPATSFMPHRDQVGDQSVITGNVHHSIDLRCPTDEFYKSSTTPR